MVVETSTSKGRRDAERALGAALGLLGQDPDRNAAEIVRAVDYIAATEKQAVIRDWIRTWLREGGPGRQFLGLLLKNAHPNVREKYVARMIVSMLFRDPKIGARCLADYGVSPPYTMLISPTMRCNYRCTGCYAASYSRADDMNARDFDRVLTEAEAMGINFFIVLGGEPFLYPDLLHVIEDHDTSFFQVYTNGSLIDAPLARRLVEFGNVAPQISVNGPREYTDASRGKGSFALAMRAMDNLHDAGCIFAFSSLVTRSNVDAIASEEWMDLLIEKGALYGWLFLYMPVGNDPDMDLMPTPEQRDLLRRAVRRYRQTKPILPIDFWNDGTLTGGCIAGGRLYFHVNHKGEVEPCIFCHFATHNIKESSLAEALGSPFFSAIKEKQPFSYNTLRPCPIIDHPQTMWGLIQQHGAKPTHPGAERIFTEFAPDMERYARRVADLMDGVWENDDYHDWAARWTGMCGIPPARLEQRRQEFQSLLATRTPSRAGTTG